MRTGATVIGKSGVKTSVRMKVQPDVANSVLLRDCGAIQ